MANGKKIVANLHIFERVLLRYAFQDLLLAAFLQLPCQEEFIQDVVCLCEGEDDVQLADVPVVLVHLLDVSVDDLECDELVVLGRAAGNEE